LFPKIEGDIKENDLPPPCPEERRRGNAVYFEFLDFSEKQV